MSDGLIRRIDRRLGQAILKLWAMVAWCGALAAFVFGAIVWSSAPVPGTLSLALGLGFLWMGRRAWTQRAALGDLLNRDYERP